MQVQTANKNSTSDEINNMTMFIWKVNGFTHDVNVYLI